MRHGGALGVVDVELQQQAMGVDSAPEMERINAIEDTGTVIVASTPGECATEMKVVHEQCKKIVAERKLSSD